MEAELEEPVELLVELPVVVPLLFTAVRVLLEDGLLIPGRGGARAQELGNLGAVGGTVMDAGLEELAELLVELFVCCRSPRSSHGTP